MGSRLGCDSAVTCSLDDNKSKYVLFFLFTLILMIFRLCYVYVGQQQQQQTMVNQQQQQQGGRGSRRNTSRAPGMFCFSLYFIHTNDILQPPDHTTTKPDPKGLRRPMQAHESMQAHDSQRRPQPRQSMQAKANVGPPTTANVGP